jgi:hypothetical protein
MVDLEAIQSAVRIVTAYEPDPGQWIEFRSRRPK